MKPPDYISIADCPTCDHIPRRSRSTPGKTRERLGRLDSDDGLSLRLRDFCRLRPGEIWEDPEQGHRVGVLDASARGDVSRLMAGSRARLALNDPPYNIVLGNKSLAAISKTGLEAYLAFSRAWVANALDALEDDGHFYVWMGSDYRDGFQPLPDFMLLMREFSDRVRPRNFITLRNQRGYGTKQNWMWVRQELLYYARGEAAFNVEAEYTDIPKILRGYYKKVGGRVTENRERSHSDNIRAGNVWVDIQQVFYRMEENVPGCYAQKPLPAIERILKAGTGKGELVLDLFAHSGTTLIAGERLGRRVFTADVEPVYAEISIRRLLRYRGTGKTGWQWESPFPELTRRRGT